MYIRKCIINTMPNDNTALHPNRIHLSKDVIGHNHNKVNGVTLSHLGKSSPSRSKNFFGSYCIMRLCIHVVDRQKNFGSSLAKFQRYEFSKLWALKRGENRKKIMLTIYLVEEKNYFNKSFRHPICPSNATKKFLKNLKF